MNFKRTNAFLFVGLFVALTLPASEAQLFKGGAQRRSVRQGGSNSSQQQGGFSGRRDQQSQNQFQQPKTGGLFKGKQQQKSNQQQQFNGGVQQPRAGMFGKAKGPKTGGLFNRNRVEASSGQLEYKEKNGLFGKAKARREEQTYGQQKYANNQSYNQQQINQQASANHVQRSQRASSTQSLFRNAVPAGQYDSGVAANSPSSQAQGTVSSTLLVGNRLSATQQSGGKRVLPVTKPSSLPEIASKERTKSGTATAVEKRNQAIVSSKPKLPQRVRSATTTIQHFKLHDTGKILPTVEPTATAPFGNEVGELSLATLA